LKERERERELTLGHRKSGGGGFWGEATPQGFFQIFEKPIYPKGLKLSVAVHSSSTEMLI